MKDENPYLAPVTGRWVSAAGIALLVAAAGLTAVLAYGLFDLVAHAASRHAFNSSSLVSTLILVALCGMCWQAGYRLAFRRPDGTGTIFSRPAWFAIGTGFVAIAALMAHAIAKGRGLALLDVQVILTLGGIGVWCVVLAFRRRRTEQ